MWEVLFQEYEMIGGENLPPVPDYGDPEYPPYDVPTTEAEFVTEVAELLTGTGGSLDTPDLELVMSQEWETFLAGLLGFVDGAQQSGGGQNSDYDDRYANTSPLGEFFVRDFGWMPSVQRLPGYHYYDYLTQDIDSEYLQMAYSVHLAASDFADAGVSLAVIENMPFQMMVEGAPITVVWHSGLAPTSNLQPDPNDPDTIIVTASLGYFTVQTQPPGPSAGEETPPTGMDLMQLNEHNALYIRFLDQALTYLAADPLALQLMLQASQMGIKVTIVTGTAESRYDNINNIVEWNPGMALRLTNGGVMSPAMILLHELAHGVFNIYGYDAQYDTLEERHIIENYERIIGQHLGEPIREDHFGTPVFAIGTVTYHTLPPPPTI